MADHSISVSTVPQAGGARLAEGGAVPEPGRETLGELFAAWVARTPHAPARDRRPAHLDLPGVGGSGPRRLRAATWCAAVPGRSGPWRWSCRARWS